MNNQEILQSSTFKQKTKTKKHTHKTQKTQKHLVSENFKAVMREGNWKIKVESQIKKKQNLFVSIFTHSAITLILLKFFQMSESTCAHDTVFSASI